MESGIRIETFGSAHSFAKFAKVGAEVAHELRKVGTATRCERTKRHINTQTRQDNGKKFLSKKYIVTIVCVCLRRNRLTGTDEAF